MFVWLSNTTTYSTVQMLVFLSFLGAFHNWSELKLGTGLYGSKIQTYHYFHGYLYLYPQNYLIPLYSSHLSSRHDIILNIHIIWNRQRSLNWYTKTENHSVLIIWSMSQKWASGGKLSLSLPLICVILYYVGGLTLSSILDWGLHLKGI